MSFSNNGTPDTRINNQLINTGPGIVHHAPAATAIRNRPHPTQKSPK
jgi:hypothetical protein